MTRAPAPGVDPKAGIRAVARGAAGWPLRLEHLGTPPPRLWLLGRDVPPGPAVAVVGARRASLVGLAAAERLGRDLAGAGITVVSGMARGIDGAAHAGALAAGGPTLAVLGCGVDVCYPPSHRSLRERLVAAGTLVTEEPPGTPPEGWRFPRRNRIIAALCVAVVVVEAGERSGALSTARWAADLGREVLAVPGSVASESCRGSNRLLRDGAGVCLGLDDVLGALAGLREAGAAAGAADGVLARLPGADGAGLAGRLRELLAGGPAHPDSLAPALGISLPRLARVLSEEELAGRLLALPDGRVAPLPLAPVRG